MNPMRNIKIAKLTLNIGVGEAGEHLEKAKKLLEKITEKKIVVTKSKRRSTFGVPRGRPIGVKVTLRNKDALELLKRALESVDKRLYSTQFDEHGNFAFGVKEYINIPGVKYDPSIGIIGMDVCVTLQRPGYRVLYRRLKPSKISKEHRIKKEEAIEWAKQTLGVVME